jgi:pimeloyl-ACP methyl ester carboxylesterase
VAAALDAGARIVCLHGLGRDPTDWELVRPGLAALAVVACPRLPRDGIAAAARAVDLPPGALLIGHSMGAVVALRLAADPANDVRALVLANCFHRPARNGRSVVATTADYARHRGAIVRELMARRHRPTPRRGTAAALRDLLHATLRGDERDADGAARIPTLVLHARDDHYIPVDFALAAVARRPAWDARILDGGGHDPHRTRPAVWLEAVVPWLTAELARTSPDEPPSVADG